MLTELPSDIESLKSVIATLKDKRVIALSKRHDHKAVELRDLIDKAQTALNDAKKKEADG